MAEKNTRVDTGKTQLKAETDALAVAQSTPAPVDTVSTPDTVVDWLARLRLLEGVPFEYLVPDTRLLPVESIRFFYLDANWTDRLVEGALSVGRTSSREHQHYRRVNAKVLEAAHQAEAAVRPSRRRTGKQKNMAPKSAPPAPGLSTGFLLRSAVVSGWPGLEAAAYGDAQRTSPIELLRMERLSDDVLLCIFAGEPKLVELREPGEGIQLGIEEGTKVMVRWIGANPARGANPIGSPMMADNVPISVQAPYRDNGERRVLDIRTLGLKLQDQVKPGEVKNIDHGDGIPTPTYVPAAPLTSAELAVQLLHSPYVQPFTGTVDQRDPILSVQLPAFVFNVGLIDYQKLLDDAK